MYAVSALKGGKGGTSAALLAKPLTLLNANGLYRTLEEYVRARRGMMDVMFRNERANYGQID